LPSAFRQWALAYLPSAPRTHRARRRTPRQSHQRPARLCRFTSAAWSGRKNKLEAAAGLAKAFTNKKGLEGFDTKRPIGLYAGVTKDVSDSPVIVLVPVVDEATVLAFMKDKANLKWKKDGDVYEVAVPQVPQPIFFKFADGYLHATIGNKANLDRALARKPSSEKKPTRSCRWPFTSTASRLT
jgi:hypothetical protein